MKITPAWKTDPEGKKVRVYLIRYQDKSKLNVNGKPVHRQESFEKKKQAEARLLVLQNEMEEGRHIAKGDKLTVAQVCDLFMKHQEDRVKDGRIGKQRAQTLEIAVRKSIIPFLGSKLFSDLEPHDIDDFYSRMIREGKLSPQSAKSRVVELRQVEEFAFRRKLVRKRSVAEGKAALSDLPKVRIKTFMPEQVKHLLKTAAQRQWAQQHRSFLLINCYVNIAAFCGLRFGEISGLSLSSVDIDRRMIHVRHSYSRLDGLKKPKTSAGVRDVPMPPHVADMIRLWLDGYYVESEHKLIFKSTWVTPPLACSFNSANWHPLLERAGLWKKGEDCLHFHALRHFAASWLVEKLPLTDVAQIMGHSKFDMTLQVYAHPMAAGHRRHEAVDGMATNLLPATDEAPIASLARRRRDVCAYTPSDVSNR